MHIFVAEDEKTIRRELTILLENAMYQVTAPENFENIPDQITEASPDLILLDVNLPGMSGFDICSMLRQRENSCPVIFLTSRTDSMDELTGMLRGGDDYITKPYQAPILLARIAAVFANKATPKTLNRAPGIVLVALGAVVMIFSLIK